MTAGTNGASDQGRGSRTSDRAELNANAHKAARLPAREMAPFSRHKRMGAPNFG